MWHPGDPGVMRRAFSGWLNSVVFVSALSLWALVSGHRSAWQSARVEVNQDNETRRQEKQDPTTEVVPQLVARPSVDEA
jgi:hypothetical protein